MPNQGSDPSDPDRWPPPDEWLADFTTRLNNSINPVHPSVLTGIPGLLGSLDGLRPATGQTGAQGPQIGATGLPAGPQVGQAATDNQGFRQYFTGYDHGGNQVWNPMGVTSDGPDASGVTEADALLATAPNPHPGGIGDTMADIAGKIWGAPNTALGLGLAGAGYIAGKIAGTNPHFQFGNNALQLVGNPLTFEPGGTVTRGNVQVYGAGANPRTPGRNYVPGLGDVSMGQHEQAHTYQSQVLGPLYLPLWGLWGGESPNNPLERDADWYGAGFGAPFSHMEPRPTPTLNKP